MVELYEYDPDEYDEDSQYNPDEYDEYGEVLEKGTWAIRKDSASPGAECFFDGDSNISVSFLYRHNNSGGTTPVVEFALVAGPNPEIVASAPLNIHNGQCINAAAIRKVARAEIGENISADQRTKRRIREVIAGLNDTILQQLTNELLSTPTSQVS